MYCTGGRSTANDGRVLLCLQALNSCRDGTAHITGGPSKWSVMATVKFLPALMAGRFNRTL